MRTQKKKTDIEKIKMRSNRLADGQPLLKGKTYTVGKDVSEDDAVVMVATRTALDVTGEKAGKKDAPKDPADK